MRRFIIDFFLLQYTKYGTRLARCLRLIFFFDFCFKRLSFKYNILILNEIVRLLYCLDEW